MKFPDPAEVRSALRARLLEVAPHIDPTVDTSASLPTLLQRLAQSVKLSEDEGAVWLLFIAISGSFPSQNEFDHFWRRLDLAQPAAALVAVLGATVDAASRPAVSLRRLEIVVDRAVVDVHFTATHEHNTGVQRVTRQTAPEWVAAGHEPVFVAWTDDLRAMRRLDAAEEDRLLHWHDRRRPDVAETAEPATVLVPWRSRVHLPEVPIHALAQPLACLAEVSGNRVSITGHDAIPIVSAESQSNEESERFAHFLTVVKRSHRVVGVSESAAEEFRGFVDAVRVQGLPGPDVVAVPLAVEVPPQALAVEAPVDARPLVLCVGSHEPRKNQQAVLAAGEVLHARGLDFELVFVGAGSRTATHAFDARVARLNRKGMPVRSLRGLPDSGLWELFARARFTVFTSLHEGFGLPVAESLAFGVPVLTSNFGSLAEIAARGGCVTVDPRNDEEIAEGMERLLTDDALLGRLRDEAARLPQRRWSQYAAELWEAAQLSGGAA